MGLLIHRWSSPVHLSSCLCISISLVSIIVSFSSDHCSHLWTGLLAPAGYPAAQAAPAARETRVTAPSRSLSLHWKASKWPPNDLPLPHLPITSWVVVFLLCLVHRPGSLVPQTCWAILTSGPPEHSHPVFAWLAASLPPGLSASSFFSVKASLTSLPLK